MISKSFVGMKTPQRSREKERKKKNLKFAITLFGGQRIHPEVENQVVPVSSMKRAEFW